jgi:hypothetical protein
MNRNQARSGGAGLRLLAILSCVFLAGCTKEPSSATIPDGPPSPDEAVLNVLEPLDPVYKLNGSGRVIRLKLEGRRIPANVLDEASKFTELIELSLYAVAISDDDLEKLEKLQNLRSLGLGATLITDKGLEHLQKLPALRYLWLPPRAANSPAAKALKAALPELTIYAQ